MRGARRVVSGLKRNSNVILGLGAMLGLGATIYFVARGQMKADDILAERNAAFDSGADETSEVEVVPSKREVFDLTWQCYIPAAISTGFTLFCIIGSNYISSKKIAALSASLAFMTANRDQLEAAIKEKYGEDALNEIKSKLQIRKPEVKVIKNIAEETGFGDLLCFEGYSGRWFRSSREAVEDAIRKLEDQFKRDEYASMNDFYDYLKIEQTHFGYDYGWIYDWIDAEDENDEPIKMVLTEVFVEEKGENVLFIDIYTYPVERYYEYRRERYFRNGQIKK